MEKPAGNCDEAWPSRSPEARRLGAPGRILGSLTIPGHPEQVATARTFVTHTLEWHRVDTDAAALLTSEIVTNAIQHTKSGIDGGTVTIVIIGIPDSVLVEVIDDGSPGTPVVKGDLYAAEGHGLFLVQHLAAQWGYLRDQAGTTVWFQLPAAEAPGAAAERAGPRADAAERAGRVPDWRGLRPPGAELYRIRPGQLRAATISSGAAPA